MSTLSPSGGLHLGGSLEEIASTLFGSRTSASSVHHVIHGLRMPCGGAEGSQFVRLAVMKSLLVPEAPRSPYYPD